MQTRIVIQRSLALIYAVAFLIVWHQYLPLLGADGLWPNIALLRTSDFWQRPTLFQIYNSAIFVKLLCGSGFVFSLLALSGLSESCGRFLRLLTWGSLWAIYLSFVIAGGQFYRFGWENLLLECGFLAIFLGDPKTKTETAILFLFRWVAFRVMFGAGLIKLRSDICWRDLTCLDFHYLTQPVPNIVSYFLHQIPSWYQRISLIMTHALELIVPFGLLIPGVVGRISALLMIGFQSILIMSGNLAWFNYITILPALACLDDSFWLKWLGEKKKPFRLKDVSAGQRFGTILLCVFVAVLSISPVKNLCRRNQLMNASFEPLHLVNTYGAFGSVTRKRFELVLEGTRDERVTPESKWEAYEFKCKPGDPKTPPCMMSPYLYKLDWQVWFVAINPKSTPPWFIHLIVQLLEGKKEALSLMGKNPFQGLPPKYIRAQIYEYDYSHLDELRKDGVWWARTYIGEPFPPISLEAPYLAMILKQLDR